MWSLTHRALGRARSLLRSLAMLTTLDRFAAYTSARDALASIQRATSAWPPDLAREATSVATKMTTKTAEAIDLDPTSAARRKCLREAICEALVLASICDLAMSHGMTSSELDESLRYASRTISMLGMSFHATAAAHD
jgi:hypothetical protein